MAAYSELQQAEFASEAVGYSATRHQREVGTGYFDAVMQAVSNGSCSTKALEGLDGRSAVRRGSAGEEERLSPATSRARGA
jgi:isocitrate lyase